MKLVRLTMTNFGKWQDKHIDFQKDLTLVYGNNEAGKTTLHHFIQTMLFGFPKRRKSFRDYEPRQGGLFGGSLTIEVTNYGEIRIERYKSINRGKAQVTLADGQEITEEELMALLSPLTAELFSEVFSLQQEQLRELKYLTEEKLQELLLAVGMTGSKKIVTVKSTLNKQEQALYKPTGRLPLINLKLKEYETIRSQVIKKTQMERQYQQQRQDLATKEQVLQDSQAKLSELKSEEQLIAQQITAFPLWQERQHLQKQLGKDGFSDIDEVSKLYQDYQFVKKEEENYLVKQKNELERSQATPAYLFYLENQVGIEKLTSQQNRMEQNRQQIKWLETRVSQRENETEQLLAELPELAIQGRYFPELLEQEQLKVLAQQEDSCHFNLQQQERHFDQVLSEIEEEAGRSKKVTEKNSQQRLGQLFGIGAAVFLLIGLSCLFLKLFLIGGLSVLASFVLLLLKGKGKAQLSPEKATSLNEKEGLLENIAEEIEKIQRELKSLQEQKQRLAETYQFKLEQSVSQWLLELPQRGQLVRVVEELASLKGELTEGQRELNSYRQEFSFMKEWLPIATSSDEELLTALTNFVAEMSQRSLALNQAGQSLTTWQEPLAELAKRRETLTVRLYSFLPAGVTHSMDNVQRLLFENQQRSHQAAELAKLSLQVDQLFNDQQDYQLATLVTIKGKLKEEIPDLIRKQQEQSRAIEKLRFLIQQQESDGTLRELYQTEANLETELRELINQWYDNRLGDEILQATLDQLAKSQLPDLLRTTTAFFKLLTAERFVEVSYEGDELLLKDQQGLDYEVKELSTGSRDQLYMATRLGFIQLHSQESLSPVIIDDGWLHYDSQRKQQLFRLLKQLSCDNQIICLSSDSELLAFMEDENEGIIVL